MILWPETGYKIAKPIQKRFPNAFSKSVKMITRYADDLDRRYPRAPVKIDQKSGSS
jgi:putative cell wall-binding protein